MKKLCLHLLLIALGVWLLCLARAQAQCPTPTLDFRDNILGDYNKVVWAWYDPPGCEFVLEGTRQLDPDPYNDPSAIWFTCMPTYKWRSVVYTNGMYRISPIGKRVFVDMEDLSEPGSLEGLSKPFAPQAWWFRLREMR